MADTAFRLVDETVLVQIVGDTGLIAPLVEAAAASELAAANYAGASGTNATIAAAAALETAADVLTVQDLIDEAVANLPAEFKGDQGDPGINGGVGSSAGYGGLFSAAAGMAVGAGITRVKLSGYAAAGIGGGDYVYDAAVDAAYVMAYPRTSFLAADGRGFRLDPHQRLTIEMFGGRADYNPTTFAGTDNLPPLLAAIAAFTFAPEFPGQIETALPIHFGDGRYWFNGSLELKKVVTLIGNGSGQNNYVGGTRWHYPPDTIAITVNNSLSHLGTKVGVANGTADGSIIRGFQFIPKEGSVTTDKPCIWLRGRATIEHCTFGERRNTPNELKGRIPGNAISIVANVASAGALYGNANGWRVTNCYVENALGHGLYVAGTDTNVGRCFGFETKFCGGCGILDISGLGGNLYLAPNLAGYANDTAPNFKGRVSYSGRQYQLIDPTPGIGASTTPGTATHIWYDMGPATTWAAWSGAATYSPDIPILIWGSSNRSFLAGFYSENGTSHVGVPSEVVGGQAAYTNHSGTYAASLAPSVTMAALSAAGLGGGRVYPTGGPATVANGTYAYATIGTEHPDGYTLGINFLEHNRAGDNVNPVTGLPETLPWYWNWVGKDQFYGERSKKPVFSIPGKHTTRTYGRTANQGQAYTMTLHDFALIDPNDTNNARIYGIRGAAPATGYHAVGEIVFNVAPTAGGFIGWVCTAAGTPGTWKTWGVVSA